MKPTPPVTCPACVARGSACPSCRLRKHRGTLVEGAVCRSPRCRVSDPRMLRRHTFADGVVILCANHDAVAGKRRIAWGEFLRELAGEVVRRSA